MNKSLLLIIILALVASIIGGYFIIKKSSNIDMTNNSQPSSINSTTNPLPNQAADTRQLIGIKIIEISQKPTTYLKAQIIDPVLTDKEHLVKNIIITDKTQIFLSDYNTKKDTPASLKELQVGDELAAWVFAPSMDEIVKESDLVADVIKKVIVH